jgi:hypothetical protein
MRIFLILALSLTLCLAFEAGIQTPAHPTRLL